MWEQNGGRCGVCGDAVHLPTPRPHEAGGTYAKGISTKFYSAGQVNGLKVKPFLNLIFQTNVFFFFHYAQHPDD